MTQYTFLDPETSFRLPRGFDYQGYIETEREFWALFPETEGKRVNFCQLGLTAQLYTESPEQDSDLETGETYFLMPCADRTMRPVRMRALRRLTLLEYRMSHLTAMRMAGYLRVTESIIESVDRAVLGSDLVQ